MMYLFGKCNENSHPVKNINNIMDSFLESISEIKMIYAFLNKFILYFTNHFQNYELSLIIINFLNSFICNFKLILL